MDIAALSMNMAQSNVLEGVGVAMLKNTLDLNDSMGEQLTAMAGSAMELSVNPSIGSNIDISV